MNTVILYGSLAEEFGERFELDVRDPREAFRALNCQLPGFARMCVEGDFFLVRELPDGSYAMTEDMLLIAMSNSTMHFIPNVEGAGQGKGIGKMVLGIGLIVGSFFIPGSIGLLAGLSLKTATLTLGLSLALGGAALLLSPTPKMDDVADTNSFIFSGDSNTAGQGFAVPVTYGYDRVRPIPIASQIKTNEHRVPHDGTHTGSGTGAPYVGDDRMYRVDL